MERRRVLALLGALTLAGTGRAGAAQGVGRVSALLGEAWRQGSGDAVPLQPGDRVAEGDHLVTGANSRLEVRFDEGSVLTVGPLSRVEIARFAPPGAGAADPVADALLRLVEGILKVAVAEGAAWEAFEVETSTAIASVRGTEWIVEESAKVTAVFVLSGAVGVRSRTLPAPAGAVMLQAGEGTDVAPGAPPTPPKVWGAARRDAAIARVSLP